MVKLADCMDNLVPPRLLSDTAYYSAHFMDPGLWEPAVHQLCVRHGFTPRRISPALPGSFPTFIVELEANEDHPSRALIVVKFFGPLLGGHNSFIIERLIGRYLAKRLLPVPSPSILAEGDLTPDWRYLIFKGISGVSIGQVREQLSQHAWACVAGQIGVFMKALHTSTVDTRPASPLPSVAITWDGFVDFLELQRANCQANHLRWNDLPPQLAEQLQDYLLPINQLVDLASLPHMIHADLTMDHLLGRIVPPPGSPSPSLVGADWESLAIIDWGDACIGNVLYELVALHLDMFKADTRLLSICLHHYRLPTFYQRDFPRKALCMVLLHQFPMPPSIYAPYHAAHSLDELAEGLFGL